MYLCSVIKKQLTLKSKPMDKEEIEQLIARKEKEIKQLFGAQRTAEVRAHI